MGKYEVSLKSANAAVKRALKKLKQIRPYVTKADQKKIDLEIRDLEKIAVTIGPVCHIRKFERAVYKKK
jgi:hypothetical protein